MALLIKKGKKIEYVSGTGIVTNEQKEKAILIHKELEGRIRKLEKELHTAGLINKRGVKKNALRIWHEFGRLLNDIGKKYGIPGTTDEIYFWPNIYNYVSRSVQRKAPPRNYKDLSRNHFKQCSVMAKYSWGMVKRVGKWAEWRDLLDNKIILTDERILYWIIKKIIKDKVGHKEFRPFLHAFRREIAKYDTRVFSDRELKKLLNKIANLIGPYVS